MARRTPRQPRLALGGFSRLLAAAPTGTAMPPAKNAPPAVYPIAVTEAQRALAPVPLNDRYPIVIGQRLDFSYLASCMRLATTGYPQQLFDLENELLEQDPHLLSVATKRNMAVANGRMELVAPVLPKGHKDIEQAKEILEFCQGEVARIPDMTQTLSSLLWGIYYGLASSEIFWNRDQGGWHIDRFGFIHRRRLAYPQSQAWDLYIWDQGQVLGWDSANSDSRHVVANYRLGLRIADWPGKFIVYAPQVRGDYPTREGIGRNVAAFAMAKRVGVRATLAYVERFSKGFFDVEFATQDSGIPREATNEDIALANRLAESIGPGSGSYAIHPDSVKVNAKSFDSGQPKIKYEDLVAICNSEESKAYLGGSLGTDAGKGSGGNRSLGEVQERAELDLEQYDATTLGEAFKRDVITWLVRLNYPAFVHLTPNVNIHVDTDPSPGVLLTDAKAMTDLGGPVDLEALSERTGIPLVANTNTDEDGNVVPRRSRKIDVFTAIKLATAADIPVDIDRVGHELGLPIVPLEEMETARRTRVVAAGKDTPVEPADDDPNAPDETALAPDSSGPVDADGNPIEPQAAPGDGKKPKPGKTKPKTQPKPKAGTPSVAGEEEPTNKKDE